MNSKLGATCGVSGGRRSVVMVRRRSRSRSGPDSDEFAVHQLPTILSTSLWKTLGTPGLTCPQAATYRGSVGVEPAVSCCAPCGFLRWCVGRLHWADPISGFVDKFVISSNRSHSSEQADVPAEQPSSAQEARLPASYAYPCGSRDHRRPPAQGPQRAVCLIRPGYRSKVSCYPQ